MTARGRLIPPQQLPEEDTDADWNDEREGRQDENNKHLGDGGTEESEQGHGEVLSTT